MNWIIKLTSISFRQTKQLSNREFFWSVALTHCVDFIILNEKGSIVHIPGGILIHSKIFNSIRVFIDKKAIWAYYWNSSENNDAISELNCSQLKSRNRFFSDRYNFPISLTIKINALNCILMHKASVISKKQKNYLVLSSTLQIDELYSVKVIHPT